MKSKTSKIILAAGYLSAGIFSVCNAQAALVSNGNISGLVASTLTPKIGEAVTMRLEGTLDTGKKCHIGGGIAISGGVFQDLGLIGELPTVLATKFTFDKPGVYYIHVYSGTQDVDNFCTQTGAGSIRFTVPEEVAPARAATTMPNISLTPKTPKAPVFDTPARPRPLFRD